MKKFQTGQERNMNIPVKTRQFPDGFEADLHTCKEPGPTTPVHTHNFVEIGFITKGRARHHLARNQENPVLAGDVFIIDRFQPHYYTETHNLEVCYLLLGPATFNKSLEDFKHISTATGIFPSHSNQLILSSPCLHPAQETAREIETIIAKVRHELTRRNWGYQLMVEALLIELFVAINRLTNEARANKILPDFDDINHQRINAVLTFIDRHFVDDLHLSDLARCACLHPQYLCRIFKEKTGMSMVEYLTHVRIGRARDLLKSTNDPVTDICFRIGFNDLSHFIRTFRKITGTTPLDFRRKSR
jgi:AraC-like DNA-binding protein